MPRVTPKHGTLAKFSKRKWCFSTGRNGFSPNTLAMRKGIHRMENVYMSGIEYVCLCVCMCVKVKGLPKSFLVGLFFFFMLAAQIS